MPTWLDGFWQAIMGFAGGAGVLGWIAKRQVDRLDRVEAALAGKAGRDELKAVAERMFNKLDEHARESRDGMEKLGGRVEASVVAIHEKLDRTIETQNAINLEVARNLRRD